MSDILEDMIYRRTLSCGTIQVTRDQGEVSLDDLFDIAERRNPKRAFLFVSKVLGRHIPVPPSVMRQAYRQLASQFPSTLTGPVLFIGMAETAVGLGAGVFDEVRHQHRESVPRFEGGRTEGRCRAATAHQGYRHLSRWSVRGGQRL